MDTDELRPKRKSIASAGSLVMLVAAGFALNGLWRVTEHEERQRAFHATVMPPSLEIVRTAVQRGTDAEAKTVNATAKVTTLKALRAVARPSSLNDSRHDYSHTRIGPLETQVWQLRAKVVSGLVRSDNDIYLVIESDGIRGCVEIPDPALCKGSQFEAQISEVRKSLLREYGFGQHSTSIDREAVLTGVGYFGTGGLRENGARLNPLLKIEWLPSRT